MNAVKVQYKVKKEFVETNKANIRQVMNDLREIDSQKIIYSAFLLDDGQSFVHFVVRVDDDAQKIVSDLPSFQEFQRQLKESGPENPPQAENLTLVDSSSSFF
jgi:hypothetical protein